MEWPCGLIFRWSIESIPLVHCEHSRYPHESDWFPAVLLKVEHFNCLASTTQTKSREKTSISISLKEMPMSCFGHGLRSGVYPPRLIPSQYNLLRNRWENDGTWMNMMLSQWIGLNSNNSVAEIRSTWGYEGDSHFQPLFQWRLSEVMIKFIRHYRCFAH